MNRSPSFGTSCCPRAARAALAIVGAALPLHAVACASDANGPPAPLEESAQSVTTQPEPTCVNPIDCIDPEVRDYLEWRFYEGTPTLTVSASSGSCEARVQVTYLARLRVGPLERVNHRVGLYYAGGSVVEVSESTPGCWTIPDLVSTATDSFEVAFMRLSDDLMVNGSLTVCGTAPLTGTVSADAVELRVGDAGASTSRAGEQCDQRCAAAGFTCSLAESVARLERIPRPTDESPYPFGAGERNGGY